MFFGTPCINKESCQSTASHYLLEKWYFEKCLLRINALLIKSLLCIDLIANNTVKNDIFDAITVLVIRSDLQDIHVILTVIIIVLKIFVYKLT